jgi:hypothetical protein
MLTIFLHAGPPLHRLDRTLAAVKGGMEVDLHLPGQLIRRDVGEIRHEAGAGVVHQCVHAAEAGSQAVEQIGHGFGIGQVDRFGDEPVAVGPHHQKGRAVDVDAHDL